MLPDVFTNPELYRYYEGQFVVNKFNSRLLNGTQVKCIHMNGSFGPIIVESEKIRDHKFVFKLLNKYFSAIRKYTKQGYNIGSYRFEPYSLSYKHRIDLTDEQKEFYSKQRVLRNVVLYKEKVKRIKTRKKMFYLR